MFHKKRYWISSGFSSKEKDRILELNGAYKSSVISYMQNQGLE